MFESFEELVNKAARSFGIAKEVQAAKICERARKIIPTLFPEGLKDDVIENIYPAFFKDSTLTLNATSPAWAQEVMMRKAKIIAQINQKEGKEIVKYLRTKYPQELSA